jgi:quinol monooxygenase YgiN
MVIVIFKMEVLAPKREEFLQTVPVILSKAAREPGCLIHKMGQDLEGENSFIVVQAWQNQPKLDAYWCSDRFGTFMGTFHLLKNKPTIEIHAVSFTSGMEAIKTARSRVKSMDTKSQQKPSQRSAK